MRRRWRTVIALSVLGILCAQAQQSMSMLVGTYTDGGSRGIYSYRFDQETGEATLQDSLALRNPSFLTISHDGGLVYAVSETNDGKYALATDFSADRILYCRERVRDIENQNV